MKKVLTVLLVLLLAFLCSCSTDTGGEEMSSDAQTTLETLTDNSEGEAVSFGTGDTDTTTAPANSGDAAKQSGSDNKESGEKTDSKDKTDSTATSNGAELSTNSKGEIELPLIPIN